MLTPWKKSYDQLRNHIKNQRCYFANKRPMFGCAMYGCESWIINKAECRRIWWTVVLEKTLESPLDCKEIKPVLPKGNQSWVFFGRTDVEAETPILWLLDDKSWLIRKDPDAGKDRKQEKKGRTEDEMVGWHHQLNQHEFEQALGDGVDCHSLLQGILSTQRSNWGLSHCR